ncbi:MAG TPA: SBBP repeat-containing protein [Blastocatellia bacterium]|nr:SBBP repeat-containing protein [Blastocatellia bacterium]
MNKLLKTLLAHISIIHLIILPTYPEKRQVVSGLIAHSNASSQTSLAGIAPLYFEENHGQFADEVRYLARYEGQRVLLTSLGMIWETRSGKSLGMKFAGTNSTVQVEGTSPLPGKVNYLWGNEQKHHYKNIPTYEKVRYRNVYAGTDLVYYFKNRILEYDFVVSPGADSRAIQLAFDQGADISLKKNGDLIVRTANGELCHHKPFAYQIINNKKQEVPAQFKRLGNGRIGFELASYNHQIPLVIDPSLTYSSYLGGSDYDIGTGIAVDSAGNIYIAGTTNSSNFPLSASAYQKQIKGSDVFITKFDATGRTVLYSTFLGGSNTENSTGIALDSGGNVYVTGSTASGDFPTTPGAYKRTVNNADAFLAKLNSAGSDLIFSTLLGGTGNETSYAVATDTTNNVYLTGSTTSDNFPTTTGVFQNTARGGGSEAFVTKFNATGSQLVYSSYLGGGSSEEGISIAVDSGGNAYLTGYTFSSNFPTTTGAYQTTFKGATNLSDAFIVKVNASGNALTYATYLGGTADDTANSIAIDAAGNAYVAGTTTGSTNDFPTTAGAFQTTYKGSSVPGPVSDVFVTKLNPAGSALAYSTYLGGNGSERANGIAVNAQGSAVITGTTGSSDFPTASDAFKIYTGSLDAFVTQLDAAGATVPYSTYLGGDGSDSGAGVVLDSSGNIYVTGNTLSPNFPVFPSAYQSNAGGGQEAFFAVIKNGTSFIATSVTAASYSGVPMARESIVSVFGGRLATRTQNGFDADPNTPGFQLPTTLAGTTVKVKDGQGIERLAPLFFASPTQINYQIPPETPLGGALVTITAEDGAVSIGSIQVVDVAPDLFSADSTGKGPAIGNAVRAKPGVAPTEEPFVRFVNNKWELIPLDLGPETDQVFLVLFGTGIRFRKDPPQVSATIGGVAARVDYAKNQCCFVGLDQVNLLIPRSLIGRGEVDVVLTVEGKASQPLKIAIK